MANSTGVRERPSGRGACCTVLYWPVVETPRTRASIFCLAFFGSALLTPLRSNHEFSHHHNTLHCCWWRHYSFMTSHTIITVKKITAHIIKYHDFLTRKQFWNSIIKKLVVVVVKLISYIRWRYYCYNLYVI